MKKQREITMNKFERAIEYNKQKNEKLDEKDGVLDRKIKSLNEKRSKLIEKIESLKKRKRYKVKDKKEHKKENNKREENNKSPFTKERSERTTNKRNEKNSGYNEILASDKSTIKKKELRKNDRERSVTPNPGEVTPAPSRKTKTVAKQQIKKESNIQIMKSSVQEIILSKVDAVDSFDKHDNISNNRYSILSRPSRGYDNNINNINRNENRRDRVSPLMYTNDRSNCRETSSRSIYGFPGRDKVNEEVTPIKRKPFEEFSNPKIINEQYYTKEMFNRSKDYYKKNYI